MTPDRNLDRSYQGQTIIWTIKFTWFHFYIYCLLIHSPQRRRISLKKTNYINQIKSLLYFILALKTKYKALIMLGKALLSFPIASSVTFPHSIYNPAQHCLHFSSSDSQVFAQQMYHSLDLKYSLPHSPWLVSSLQLSLSLSNAPLERPFSKSI